MFLTGINIGLPPKYVVTPESINKRTVNWIGKKMDKRIESL